MVLNKKIIPITLGLVWLGLWMFSQQTHAVTWEQVRSVPFDQSISSYNVVWWNDFFTTLGSFAWSEKVWVWQSWVEQGYLSPGETCTYHTTSDGIQTYGTSSWGNSCEPKFVMYPVYWTPNPVKVVLPWTWLVNAVNPEAWWAGWKIFVEGKFNNLLPTSWQSNTIHGKFVNFIPTQPETFGLNGKYNDGSMASYIDKKEWDQAGISFQFNRRVRRDLHPSTKMNDLWSFKENMKYQTIISRLIDWSAIGWNYSVSKPQYYYNKYRFYWSPTIEYDKINKNSQAILNRTNWSWACDIVVGSKIYWTSGTKCKKGKDEGFKFKRLLNTSRYADVTGTTNQINRGAYTRHNAMSFEDAWNKGKSYGHAAVKMTKWINGGSQRFGVIWQHVNYFRWWQWTIGDRVVMWEDLPLNYRPQMIFNLNFIWFVAKWPWVPPPVSRNEKRMIASAGYISWNNIARDNQAAANHHNETRDSKDYNGYVSWHVGYSNTNIDKYAVTWASVWEATQFNMLFKHAWVVNIPYGSDNRYGYYLPIGFCWDGLIQANFGEKCDWPWCSVDCQAPISWACWNGKIDKIEWPNNFYVNKKGQKVPIYEQCDPAMFENDEINKTMDSVWAGGKYTENNNPCYSVKEAAEAAKYGLKPCNWKIPTGAITVKNNSNSYWTNEKIDSDVSLDSYPAWATPMDMRIFKYVFKKDANGNPDLEDEIKKVNQMSFNDKLKHYFVTLKAQAVIKETFNAPLCQALNTWEHRVKAICSNDMASPQAWHCDIGYGRLAPHITAPTLFKTKKDNFSQWETTKKWAISMKQVVPNWLKELAKNITIQNGTEQLYTYGVLPSTIGKWKPNIKVLENTALEKHNNQIFINSDGCSTSWNPANVKDYYDGKLTLTWVPLSESNKYVSRPIYWSLLYNNVALSFGYSVINLITELDKGTSKQETIISCEESWIMIKPKAWQPKDVNINLSKAYNNKLLLSQPTFFKDYLFCPTIVEKDKPAVPLMHWITKSIKLQDGKVVNTQCVKASEWIQKITSNNLNFTFTRWLNPQGQLIPGSLVLVAFQPNKINNTYQQMPKICVADLSWNGWLNTQCNETNFTKWYEKPNKTEVLNGDTWNLNWFN